MCPSEDSSLGLHGLRTEPQRDDLTTNRQGPVVVLDNMLYTISAISRAPKQTLT